MKIAIIGLGYVGLPLALRFARAGVSVLGVDVDATKCAALNAGQSYIKHVPTESVRKTRDGGLLEATTDFARTREAEAVLLCVPTPLNSQREPDMAYVFGTGESLAPHLQKGQLVVLESTTYPGTTDTDLRAILERGSGLVAGRDFHLAFSPEREDPGNTSCEANKIPKIVGGLTPSCRARAVACYSLVVERVVPVSSCRVAEAAKLLENIYRSVNIALVNELKVVYTAMGIDVWEVIEAAKTKPFGFMPFYPGPGLGGHCIPIDPFYLTWKAREFGQHTRFIELAGEVNTSMPAYVVACVEKALGCSLSGAKVLLLGLAYKPDVDDDRESPAYALMELFEAQGANVAYHDPHVPVIRPTREHPKFAGRQSVTLSPLGHDLAVLVTAHAEYRNFDFSTWPIPLVDTRNCATLRPVKYFRA
ncbi:MAG TPA: nucleotide sugar dehydrogenase [Opitutales bacterium]|jgi:UDP-N-acetyl-D-glucosamine dehydrogenase|nr:nucleotide sugar dehydrogenase [Opitutales bacterium]